MIQTDKQFLNPDKIRGEFLPSIDDDELRKKIELEFNKKLLNSPVLPHTHTQDKIMYDDLQNSPTLYARTATSVDLSGAASTLICFHTERQATLLKAFLLYTEASSADAGVNIKIGTEADDDYYYTGTTETSKSKWYSKEVTLLNKTIPLGDTVVLTNAGGKAGTGEIMLVIEYKFK